MKHLIIAVTAAVVLLSCKKDKQTTAFNKKLTEMKLSNGGYYNFSYNNAGLITNASGKFTTTVYQQQKAFESKHTYLSSGNVYDLKNTVRNASGKIIYAERFQNGILFSKVELNYSPDGYLTKATWSKDGAVSKTELFFFYENGNLVKVTNHSNGQLTNTYLYEYDLNTLNPLQLDWYEFNQIGHITDDQFGKFSKNLIKKYKVLDKNGNVFTETQFNFIRDAEGYPVSLDEKANNYNVKYTFKFE